MSVSARVHYAAQALIELASRREDPTPVTIREITDRHGVPGPFLTQILRTLRAAGWVHSIRGSQGGYRIAVDPESISLLDIARVVGGCETAATGGDDDSDSGARLREVWCQAQRASESVLAEKTLGDLVDEIRCGNETMYFI